jgi:hypothetical protein
MRNATVRNFWLLAFLITGLLAGCGREQALGPAQPAVVSTTPANGAIGVILNSVVTATFNQTMAPATISATTFTLAGPGGAVAGAVTYAGTTATFTPSTSLAAATLYTATITTGAQNALGTGLLSNYVWTFTTGAPTVISTVPAAGASLVPVNTVVSATFSEAMNAATLNAATFTLKGPGVTPVGGVVTYAGSTATFTSATVLAANTLFTATITTGAKDPAGAALAANFVWTFTTAPPPTVVSTVPANLATLVAVNTTVTATFSESMDPTTISGATFKLTGPGATPVAGAVTSSGSTATFTPTAILPASTLFTATIATGAKDLTGAAGRQLCVDFYYRSAAHGRLDSSGKRGYRRRVEHDGNSHVQRGDGPHNDHGNNFHSDWTGGNARTGRRDLCRDHSDVHTNLASRR